CNRRVRQLSRCARVQTHLTAVPCWRGHGRRRLSARRGLPRCEAGVVAAGPVRDGLPLLRQARGLAGCAVRVLA
ncbi:unnamed protein product, partial [Prorocentrum cordatum]